jgi:predicted alpha/beta hydrolase
MNKQHKRSVTLTTHNQQPLQAYWYSPQALERSTAKGKIVLASAMGVSQSYYQPLAEWLVEQGYSVLTFDTQGMGESLVKKIQDYHCDLIDWATDDYSTALKFVLECQPSAPVYWLGHSLAGQLFPLVKGIEQVSKVVTIASGTGYWKHNASQLRNKAPFFWYLIVPLATGLFGYFPGQRLGIIGNIPKQVMYQWRRWCLHPEYCVGVEHNGIRTKFANIDLPIKSLSFTDDQMLSKDNMQDLLALFGSQNKELIEIDPRQIGAKRIGHFGFFRAEFSHTLWTDVLLKELQSI